MVRQIVPSPLAPSPCCLPPHLQAKAFYTWVDHVQWRKRMRVVMDRTARRMRNAGMARAFDAWRTAVEGSKVDFHLTKKEELAVRMHGGGNTGPVIPLLRGPPELPNPPTAGPVIPNAL